MPEFNLTPDDNRIGVFSEDNAVVKWPELDIDGQPYARKNITIRRITGTRYFVAIAPGKDAPDLVVSVAEAPIVPEPVVLNRRRKDEAGE